MGDQTSEVSHAVSVLEHIVKSVVENPDEVQIDIQSNEELTTLAQ